MEMNHHRISGIIPPLVTPMTPDLRLDVDALDRLISHVISGGVHGIFLLGTTGEGSSLTSELKNQVITEGTKRVSGRLPVFINISSPSYLEVIELAKTASGEGADYVVLAPPYYFDMNQHELKRFIEMVADRSPLPLLLYNAPQYTKTEIDPETVKDLASHENIVGIKDSSGNQVYLQNLITGRSRDSFSILVGPELLLGRSLLLGCDGGVNGGGNLFPALYVKMYQSAIDKNQDDIGKCQAHMEMIAQKIYNAADSPMSIVIGLKYALSLRDICAPQMATPVYGNLTDDQKHIIRSLENDFRAYGY